MIEERQTHDGGFKAKVVIVFNSEICKNEKRLANEQRYQQKN